MIEYFLWGVSFIGLFVGIFWAQVVFMPEKYSNQKLKEFPVISLLIPAWNEESTLRKTVESLFELKYPKDKLQILIIDHGSWDKTSEVANVLIQENKGWDIQLVERKRSPEDFTKAPALNEGLKHVKGKYVGCLDSDSTVDSDVLIKMLPMFKYEKVAAVITAIKVSNPDTIWGRIQRIEYILATFVRMLMSKVDTLHITPGALSLYDSKVLKNLGGFDEKNITEDYEIAMRIKYNGYNIKINPDAVSYTNVPSTFKALWSQRVRWFRGFMVTMRKYKKMFGNKSMGMMGVFQYPLNLISFCVVIFGFGLSMYVLGLNLYHSFMKISVLKFGIFDLMKFPELKDIIIKTNLKILFPIAVSFAVGLYICHLAHKRIGEKWKHPSALLAYFFLYPPLRTAHWMTALYKEVLRRKSKW